MYILGFVVSVCAFLLDGLLIVKGIRSRLYKLFPLFYSYLIYAFLGSLGMYVIYGLFPHVYPSAYWIYYLVTILVEFAVLVEISDQIFRSLPAIRKLGRALTVFVTVGLGLLYILPTILVGPASRSHSLLDFTLRASVTKAVILIVLFYMARHYDCQMGRNVAGLMLGFSIYVALNATIMACAMAFGSALFAPVLWFMEPLAFALCLVVWTVSLWELAPMPRMGGVSPVVGRDFQSVTLELTRFNSELSKLPHK